MENLNNVINNLSDEELADVAGGKKDGCGWVCTYTLDCPGTRWFNCC
ncbi:type A2 lanthipeptide [Paenibacillus assamensis]|nr:type A2 lanthipeptide [Paenibacillus assamensis]